MSFVIGEPCIDVMGRAWVGEWPVAGHPAPAKHRARIPGAGR